MARVASSIHVAAIKRYPLSLLVKEQAVRHQTHKG